MQDKMAAAHETVFSFATDIDK